MMNYDDRRLEGQNMKSSKREKAREMIEQWPSYFQCGTRQEYVAFTQVNLNFAVMYVSVWLGYVCACALNSN